MAGLAVKRTLPVMRTTIGDSVLACCALLAHQHDLRYLVPSAAAVNVPGYKNTSNAMPRLAVLASDVWSLVRSWKCSGRAAVHSTRPVSYTWERLEADGEGDQRRKEDMRE
ncbi:hypothetical protein CPLU01_15524 [Colletotrichum plurivorum]|uniref:Uncharacterized protein n=1 Tax=Colletotrichum plurivorum TaxID=2175906 RepID=A0A8H6JB34_9PEZI|nr:hypothetical protein CPLU01_15524 [Colletotrichum plurivorum]